MPKNYVSVGNNLSEQVGKVLNGPVDGDPIGGL